MNRYRPLLAALLFAALGASPAAYFDGGMLGSGTRTGSTSFFDGGGYLGSGNKSDDGDDGGVIGSGTRTDGSSFLDENRGGYFGSGH